MNQRCQEQRKKNGIGFLSMMNRLAKVNIQAAVTCRIPFVISQKNELPNKTIGKAARI